MKKNVLFIWVPKVAGTSIYETLHNLCGMRKLKSAGHWPKFENSGIVTFGHVSIQALREQGYMSDAYYKNAFKFAFVRNPLDRMVSLYHYSLRIGRTKPDMSFKDFCRRVAKGVPEIGLYNSQGLSQANSQSSWIPEDIDFIGRFEKLQDHFAALLKKLELPNVDLARKRVSKERRELLSYYNESSTRLVKELYKDDFDRFNY